MAQKGMKMKMEMEIGSLKFSSLTIIFARVEISRKFSSSHHSRIFLLALISSNI